MIITPDQYAEARRAYFRLGEILALAEEAEELPDALFLDGVSCLAALALALAGADSPELMELDSKARAARAGEVPS